MTCEIRVRRDGIERGQGLTSDSSMRMASRSWHRNSWASCWRKSRYWSYFFPSVARRSLDGVQRGGRGWWGDAPGAQVFEFAVVLDVPCGAQQGDELVADREGV